MVQYFGLRGLLQSYLPHTKARNVQSEMPPLTEHVVLRDLDIENIADFEVYLKHGGYESLRAALKKTPADIIQIVKDSGLRGRGGHAGLRREPEGVARDGPGGEGQQRNDKHCRDKDTRDRVRHALDRRL